MRDQRPAVVHTGQVVVLGEIAEPLLGGDAGLQLREQGGDGLERVDLFLFPLAGTEFDEAEHPGARIAGHQRRGGHRRRRGRLAPAQRAADPTLGLVRPHHHRFPVALTVGEHRLDAVRPQGGHQVRIPAAGSRWPFADQGPGGGVALVVAQEAAVHIELLGELREYLFADRGRGGRRHLHQRGRDRRDHQVQAAWHGVLRYGARSRLGPAGRARAFLNGSPGRLLLAEFRPARSRRRNPFENGITHDPPHPGLGKRRRRRTVAMADIGHCPFAEAESLGMSSVAMGYSPEPSRPSRASAMGA